MTAGIRDFELRHATIVPGSSRNAMPLSTLKVGIPRDNMVRQPVKVSRFGGNASLTLGFIELDMTIGPMRASTRFHVFDGITVYHLLLGRL